MPPDLPAGRARLQAEAAHMRRGPLRPRYRSAVVNAHAAAGLLSFASLTKAHVHVAAWLALLVILTMARSAADLAARVRHGPPLPLRGRHLGAADGTRGRLHAQGQDRRAA